MSESTTTAKGLPQENFGIPSLRLDSCSKTQIPAEWEIDEVFGDIIMGTYVDEVADGEIMRGGIVIQQDIARTAWRVVKVIKKGPKVSDRIEPDDCLMVPGDRGIPGVDKDGQKLLFFNEERVFAKVKPRAV